MGGWQGQPAAVLTIGATFLGSKRREWARHALALEKKSRSPPPKSTYIGGHVAPGLLIVARKLGLVLLKSRAVPKAVWQAGAGGGSPKWGTEGLECLSSGHLQPWVADGHAWQRSRLRAGPKGHELGLKACSLAVLASEQWPSSS